MKKIANAVLAVILVLMLCVSALSEAVTGVNKMAYYDNIRTYVQRGVYDMAVAVYEEQAAALISYKDAYAYYCYALGWLAIIDDRIEDAEGYFRVLKNTYGENFPEAYLGAPDCEKIYRYIQARSAESKGEYEEAMELYNSVSGFYDTLSRVINLDALINKGNEIAPARISIAGCSATATTVDVSWTDAVNSTDNYTVIITPVGGGEEMVISTTDKNYILTGLLPDTKYEIHIQSANGEECVSSFMTSYVPLSGPIARESRAGLIYCKKAEATKYSLSDLLMRGLLNAPSQTEDGKNIILVNKGFSEGYYTYYLDIDISNGQDSKTTMEWMMVIRLDQGGTYSVNGTLNAPMSGLLVPSPFVASLSDLLSQIYNGSDGRWVETNGVIDLYIDGMYMDEIPMCLKLD